MTNPDGVLDAIDSALRDYTVSPDAMRCAPDAEPKSAPAGVPEWQYVTVGTDPAVVEVRRYGQPWGAYLYLPELALEGTTLPPE